MNETMYTVMADIGGEWDEFNYFSNLDNAMVYAYRLYAKNKCHVKIVDDFYCTVATEEDLV